MSQIASSAWQRRRSSRGEIIGSVNWLIVLGFVAAMVALGVVLWLAQPTGGGQDAFSYFDAIPSIVGPVTLAFVIVGWIFSLCMHEFGHAATAMLGGDDSPGTRKYLSFNPLHYLHPVFSLVLPVFFLLLGGIGLPGGAVYLQRNRLRNSNWQVFVSLAGPLANAVFVLLLVVPYQVAARTGHYYLAWAVAVLVFFEIFAIILNLLPIPPLDGYHAIQDWLPASWQYSPWVNGYYFVMLLFLALWLIPALNQAFQQLILNVGSHVGFDAFDSQVGYYVLFFWRR